MTEYEAASLTASHIGLGVAAGNMLAAFVAAWGIQHFGSAMNRANAARAAQAAEDGKATQAMLASLERQDAALERQGAALEELIRRTSPPQAGPAE